MRDIGNGAIVLGNAINRDHPLSLSLAGLWIAMPGLCGGLSLRDASLAKNKAQFSGATLPKWTGPQGNAIFKNAVYFDGSTSVATTATLRNFPRNGWTVGGWIKSVATTGNGHAISIGDSTSQWDGGISPHRSGTFQGYQYDVYRNSSVAANTAWNHVALSRTSSTVGTLWVNGVSYSANPTGTPVDNMVVSFGKPSGYALPWNGWISSAAVWARVLTQTDIASWINESRRGYPTMLNRLSPLRTFYFGTAAGAPPSSTFDVIGGGCGQFMIGAD